MNLDEEIKRREMRTVRRGHRPLGPPDPRRRHCPSCGLWVEVGDDWRCPTPDCMVRGEQTLLVYSHTKMDCENCGRTRNAQYVGNKIRPIGQCRCEETPKERQLREDRERVIARQEAETKQHVEMAEKSWTCWKDEMKGDCKVAIDTFPHCYTCIRFKEGAHYQGLRRAKERERRYLEG